jgi:hypothetical protein
VTAADYRAFLPAVQPMLQRIRRQDRVQPPDAAELRRLSEVAAAFTDEPRSLTELREHLAAQGGDTPPEEALWWLRRHAAFVHAPVDGAPWSFGRRPQLVHAPTWLGDPDPFDADDAALDHLARRYLAAFGPATAADLGQWSGLAVGRVRPALDRLEQDGELRRFATSAVGRCSTSSTRRDRRRRPRRRHACCRCGTARSSRSTTGRGSSATRTGPSSSPRMATRCRRSRSTAASRPVVGGARPTDGRAPPRPRAVRAHPAAARRGLERELEALAALIAPHEPAVYARYQRWRPQP